MSLLLAVIIAVPVGYATIAVIYGIMYLITFILSVTGEQPEAPYMFYSDDSGEEAVYIKHEDGTISLAYLL